GAINKVSPARLALFCPAKPCEADPLEPIHVPFQTGVPSHFETDEALDTALPTGLSSSGVAPI
ncbi:MAG: hypothetical protein V3T44_01475, partial [bacterium]